MSMKRIGLIVAAALVALPTLAFADAEAIDFTAMMQTCADFEFGGDQPLSHLDPAAADENGNGVLDATEFATISAICADAGLPNHDLVHEAYKVNRMQADTDLGPLAHALIPVFHEVMAAYATLGDGSYTRDPDTFSGSWGVLAEHIQALDGSGSQWASGAPNDADYVRNAMPFEDTDGDGMPDVWETAYGLDPDDDTDAAGDLDSDGLTNLEEYGNGTNPGSADTDGDGLGDGDEVSTHGTSPTNADSDGDGLSDGDEVNTHSTDPLNPDSDGDGMPDGWEIGNGLNPLVDESTFDTDSDGLNDMEEFLLGADPNNTDSDGDGLSDGDEVHTYGTNPTNLDTDGDGLSDSDEISTYGTNPADNDSDGDNMLDGWEIDNGLNPLTDDAEEDPDGDGLMNLGEYHYDTDPNDPDSDGDGLNDYDEVIVHGTDPSNPDSDSDGLSDSDEINVHGTNPTMWDTDGDGLGDGWEITYGLDPIVGAGDDGATGDPDGDGLPNSFEQDQGSDPQQSMWGWVINPANGHSYRLTDEMTWEAAQERAVEWGGYLTTVNDADENVWLHGNFSYVCPAFIGANDKEEEGTWVWVEDGTPFWSGDSSGAPVGGAFALWGGGEPNNSNNEDIGEMRWDGLWNDNNGGQGGVIRRGIVERNYIDSDDDRLPDVDEATAGTDPSNPDTDGDGMLDGWEVTHGLNPLVDDASADPDGDTLTNGEEHDLNTDPFSTDSDGDGLDDIDEVNVYGTDPASEDTDEDGLSDGVETNTGIYVSPTDTGTDPLDPDADGDSLLDGVETNTGTYVSTEDTGTDPFNVDTDGDGFNDRLEVYYEVDPLNPAEPDQPSRLYSVGQQTLLFSDPDINCYFPVWSSSGRRVAFVGRQLSGATDLYVTDLDRDISDPLHTIQITYPGEMSDDWHLVGWSPDDTVILYQGQGDVVTRKSSDGSGTYYAPIPLPSGGFDGAHTTCLPGGAGNRFLMGSGGSLYVCEITPAAGVISGPTLVYQPGWSEDTRFGRLSPDGSKAVFNIRPDGDNTLGDIYVLDLDAVLTGALPVPLSVADGLASGALWAAENRINYAQCPSFSNDGELVFWSEDVARAFVEPVQPSLLTQTNFDVMIGSADGTGVPQQLLFRIDGAQIHTSPGGLRMSYTRDWDLYAVTLVATQQVEGTYDEIENDVTTVGEQVVEDGSGTELTIGDNVVVNFPPAVEPEITMESPVSPVEDPQLPPEVDAVPVVRTFGPSGTTFSEPIAVTITYTDAQIAGMVEATLRVFVYNEATGVFDIEIPETDIVERDLANNSITFLVDHFSTFGLGAETDTDGDGDPDDTDPDDDNDGILDGDDAMPLDTDNDGLDNADDPDDDADGVPDGDDAFPLDTDNDGLDNAADDDDDGDGLLDADEGMGDLDADGIPNNLDTDSDSDGYGDAQETLAGSDPYDAGSDPTDTVETLYRMGPATDLLDAAFYAGEAADGSDIAGREAFWGRASNDGTTVAFYAVNRNTWNLAVFLVDLGDPSSWRRLTIDMDVSPSAPIQWTPDGLNIVFGPWRASIATGAMAEHTVHGYRLDDTSATRLPADNWMVTYDPSGTRHTNLVALPIWADGTQDPTREPIILTDMYWEGIEPDWPHIAPDGSRIGFSDYQGNPPGTADYGDVYVIENVLDIMAAPKVPGTDFSSAAVSGTADPNLVPIRVAETDNFAHVPVFSEDLSLVFFTEDWNNVFRDNDFYGTLPGADFDVMIANADGSGDDLRFEELGNQAFSGVTPGGTRILYMSDVGGQMHIYATTLEVSTGFVGSTVGDPAENDILTEWEQEASDASGTEVVVPADTTIDFPEGEPQEIQISTPIDPATEPELPAGVDAIPVVREFGPSGTQFSQPVTVTISYTDAEIAGMDEATLRVFRYNEVSGLYDTEVTTIVARDLVNNTISFTLDGFSKYGLASLLDTDGDGDPNVTDPDDDNDGLLDEVDPFPLDSDNDGVDNADDPDDDNDGLPDGDEATYGANPLDNDSDNDGVFDGDEVLFGTSPSDATDYPNDATGITTPTVSRVQFNRRTGQYSATITLANPAGSGLDTAYPVVLVIWNVSAPTVSVVGADGHVATGEAYLDLTSLFAATTPGTPVTVRIVFDNATRERFTFYPAVYAGL